MPKARGLAERLRQEAEAYKSRVVSQAEGDANRFNQVYAQYEKAPKVTRDRMYVDTMQQIFNNTTKVMVDNKSSNNLLYLPLDQLAKRAAPTQAAASAAPVQPTVPASSAQQTHNLPGGDQPPLTPDASQPTSSILSRTLR